MTAGIHPEPGVLLRERFVARDHWVAVQVQAARHGGEAPLACAARQLGTGARLRDRHRTAPAAIHSPSVPGSGTVAESKPIARE